VKLCVLLGALIPGFEETCNAFMEAQLPAIIEGIVENNLNPQDVCLAIGFCPWAGSLFSTFCTQKIL
jgi:hypothetical protein